MKQYDKLIIVSCSNAHLISKLSDALLLTFKERFKKNLRFYEDILVFNSAGSFVTSDVIAALKECKAKGENPLVFTFVHTEPKCRGTKINELKMDILAAFKSRLNWSEADVAKWTQGYGYSLDEVFVPVNNDFNELVKDQARLISSENVDFICGVLNFKTGVLSQVLHNISFSNKEQISLKKAIFKQAVTAPKTLTPKNPTYIVFSLPGVNARRLLKITKPGMVFPVSINTVKVDVKAISSIAMFVMLMAQDPRIRLVAPVDRMKELENWIEKDAFVQALYATGIRKPSFYIKV